jgi:hypothetical protein
MAIKVIENDPRVIGVILRADLDYKSELSPWRWVDGIEYRLRCRKVEGMGWGAWTNGAAIWDRDLLEKEFGPQSEAWGDGSELEYAKRVGAKCELWGVSRLFKRQAQHIIGAKCNVGGCLGLATCAGYRGGVGISRRLSFSLMLGGLQVQ